MRLALALGVIIGAGACTSAAAQQAPIGPSNSRQLQFGLTTDVIYDSNLAHGSTALARTLVITPSDETFRPLVNATVVQPIGRQAFFLNMAAGYDFHRYNKQLDHINANATGGARVITGPCQTTLTGTYAAAQSDPYDVPGGSGKNLLTDTTESVGVSCGAPSGFGGQLAVQHGDTNNSNATRASSDHTVEGVSGSFGYSNPGLGTFGLSASESKQTYSNRMNAKGGLGDSYTSTTVGLVYSKTLGSRLSASLSVGGSQVKRESAPPGIPLTTQGLSYHAAVTYNLGPSLQLQSNLSRAYTPSNSPGKLYDLVTSASLTGRYNLGSRFVVSAGGTVEKSVSNSDTSGPFTLATSFRMQSYNASIRYQQSSKASISLSVQQEQKTANIHTFDYTNTEAKISLGLSY